MGTSPLSETLANRYVAGSGPVGGSHADGKSLLQVAVVAAGLAAVALWRRRFSAAGIRSVIPPLFSQPPHHPSCSMAMVSWKEFAGGAGGLFPPGRREVRQKFAYEKVLEYLSHSPCEARTRGIIGRLEEYWEFLRCDMGRQGQNADSNGLFVRRQNLLNEIAAHLGNPDFFHRYRKIDECLDTHWVTLLRHREVRHKTLLVTESYETQLRNLQNVLNQLEWYSWLYQFPAETILAPVRQAHADLRRLFLVNLMCDGKWASTEVGNSFGDFARDCLERGLLKAEVHQAVRRRGSKLLQAEENPATLSLNENYFKKIVKDARFRLELKVDWVEEFLARFRNLKGHPAGPRHRAFAAARPVAEKILRAKMEGTPIVLDRVQIGSLMKEMHAAALQLKIVSD